MHLFSDFNCRSSKKSLYIWRRPPGRPRKTWMKNIHDDLSSLDLGIHEAIDLAQNRPLCRLMSLHSATHALVVVHGMHATTRFLSTG